MTTIEINGIPTEVPADAVAYKYADPTEDARWIYDADEAREIAAEDPSLILWANTYTIRVMDGTPAEGGSVWNYSPTITAKSTDEALDAVEADIEANHWPKAHAYDCDVGDSISITIVATDEAGNRAVRTLSYEAA